MSEVELMRVKDLIEKALDARDAMCRDVFHALKYSTVYECFFTAGDSGVGAIQRGVEAIKKLQAQLHALPDFEELNEKLQRAYHEEFDRRNEALAREFLEMDY